MQSVRLVFDRLESLSTDPADYLAQQIKIRPVRTEEVKKAISCTKPSAKVLADRYLEWQRDYESV